MTIEIKTMRTTGCLEQRRVNPHQVSTYFSLRDCAPAHTDPNVVSSYCVRLSDMAELGHYCYPVAKGTWHCL